MIFVIVIYLTSDVASHKEEVKRVNNQQEKRGLYRTTRNLIRRLEPFLQAVKIQSSRVKQPKFRCTSNVDLKLSCYLLLPEDDNSTV